MTLEQLKIANEITARIQSVDSQIKTITGLINNAGNSTLGETFKFEMSIKPAGWTGPTYSYFTNEEILDILNKKRMDLELELFKLNQKLEVL